MYECTPRNVPVNFYSEADFLIMFKKTFFGRVTKIEKFGSELHIVVRIRNINDVIKYF